MHDAWERLSSKMNLPIKDLKSKKEVLMGTFRRHLKKKQNSTRSGAGSDEIYEPIWFAYELMESFLLPIYTSRKTLNTEAGTSASQIAKETFGDETSRDPSETFGDETTATEEMDILLSPATSNEKTRSTSSKKIRRCSALDTAEQQMATAFGQLTNVLGQCQSHPGPKEDDDCDLYAKLLATKLRELSKDERKLVMYEIDGIFVNTIKCRLSRRETPSPQYSNSYSKTPSSTSYSSSPSELNIHVPNRPSSILSSYVEPITTIHPSNRSVRLAVQPPHVQSVNSYSIHPPLMQSPNIYSVHPPPVISYNSPITETIPKSNILEIALSDSFEPNDTGEQITI